MMFTVRDVRKAASLVLLLVLLGLVYIHEISKKNPSSHEDLAPIPMRGWNFFGSFMYVDCTRTSNRTSNSTEERFAMPPFCQEQA
jgi:hypothetical protein